MGITAVSVGINLVSVGIAAISVTSTIIGTVGGMGVRVPISCWQEMMRINRTRSGRRDKNFIG